MIRTHTTFRIEGTIFLEIHTSSKTLEKLFTTLSILYAKEKTVKENSSAAFSYFLPFGHQTDIKKGLQQGENLANKPVL